MAISPPSDLILDVVRAADPTDVAAAQEKMKANRAAFAATSLADKGNGFDNAVSVLNSAASKAKLDQASQADTGEVPKVYKQFEAVILQNFIKEMLPKDSEAVYGKGNAGGIWKSMMAEQIGNVMSERGGVGIADQMYSQALAAHRNEGVVSSKTDEDKRNLAVSMITDIERRTFGPSATESKDQS
ncbi:rod-binding protein [Rhizobium halophytocola]|uniref:Rod binding domain-containing protein n=1 Tax=Rhizobium halophytocola TaxID=735519 RepID=A0ABS4E5B7_9HYPH|nr:rod-binding protein [Rhizobium halophytocola]MBP1853145.1 Rod binding domain-containing protein [Rhizobium halophytocola]